MAADSNPPIAVRKIVELVQKHTAGVPRAVLVEEARARYPGMPAARLTRLVGQALAAGLIQEKEGVFAVAPRPETSTAIVPDRNPEQRRAGWRAVAVDLESIVRATSAAPYLERRVYQIGAVRFGTDQSWMEQVPRWERYVSLADGHDSIHDPAVRQQACELGVPPEQVWREFGSYCAAADFAIAYNGTALDFPLIRESAGRTGCDDPLAGIDLVDGLYLGHAVWPTKHSHRLHELAKSTATDVSGLRWHDAGDDAELLVRLLERARDEIAAWDPDLRSLVAEVCSDSAAWRLMWQLISDTDDLTDISQSAWDHHRVTELISRQLKGDLRRRGSRNVPKGRAPVTIPADLRGDDGRVSPHALAALVHGGDAEPRPAQERMATVLHTWTDQGVSGLLEAPTGTGKSYAVLAAALDWLAGDPARTAVVATYTKQLQNQLARDLRTLEDAALPGLLAVSDLIKGRANRLSLAVLTSHLAEAAEADPAPRSQTRFLDRPRFRELAVYLLLRLRASTEILDVWTARSVDPGDLPAFFGDYVSGPNLYMWLQALSQRVGDYQADADSPLAPYTDTVREAIAGHRLVLANHALVLTHLDDLRSLGPDVLLVIDEAHELESAATSALTVTADYQDLEDLLAECQAWCREAQTCPARERAASAVDELEHLLDDEQLPRLAAQAFDAHAKGVGTRVGTRSAVLASPYVGTSNSVDERRILRFLSLASGAISGFSAALVGYAAGSADDRDAHLRDRTHGLIRRADECAGALDRIASDIEALRNPTPPLDDGEESAETLPSRVVYLDELAAPGPGLRSYRFRLCSSPIDLPADPEWRRYLESFTRVHYVSATLRVAGDWDFVCERLGLSADLPMLTLPSPFDLAQQAELVCFSDFPSWAEQEEGAMRTVAHQLVGYAEEMTRGRPGRPGCDGGAMVLTTARATAAGIGDLLERELGARSMPTPVVNAIVLGNGRAVAAFTDQEQGGGFLVGTKGLWQGVDVSDERLLRLVWINKLPFAPFAAPVIEARRASVRERAERDGDPDPDGAATERYYLPLAAVQLRQAVGRLIRSDRHRGVVVISDRKLGGHTALRRLYRRVFLGSLDEDLLRADEHTGEPGAGNVASMVEGWRRIWQFMDRQGLMAPGRCAALCTAAALERQALLPQTRRIRQLALTQQETTRLRAEGRLSEEVLARAAKIGGLLRLSDEPITLKPAQHAVISAVAEGRNVLGLLPTGFGKSYTFQLPALVLPGITIVVSPLVALMHDQALELNRSIGGAVRALISPLRESSSRAGKTEVADQLSDHGEHDIKLVYVSPERMCQRRFRELVREAVRAGRVSRIAVDEAHTLPQWEDFRPGMRRVSRFLAELREEFGLPVTALTATANRSVHAAMRESLFGLSADPPSAGSAEEKAETELAGVRGGLVTVRENPIRPELAVFRRRFDQLGPNGTAGLVERVIDEVEGHAIFYCLTVKEVNAFHAHLREYVGAGDVRVRRFHGRLTEAEKAAVTAEFRDAPKVDEEGFSPLVIVATSAFGLGINRPDVRTVFCVSPPTDLAALYQQIGRAGRDAGRHENPVGGPGNTALALASNRGLRTVQFMTGQELPEQLQRRMGRAVLAQRDSLDARVVAEQIAAEEVTAGRLDEDQLASSYLIDSYTTGVMRAFSALADLGAVIDLGDYPPVCVIRPGEIPPPERNEAVERRIVEAVLSLSGRTRVRVGTIHARLAELIGSYREMADGPAGTWEILAELHDRGHLDVSAAPSRRLVTGLKVLQRTLPDGYLPLLARRTSRAREELALLTDFFRDSTTCAQRKFADYFGVPELPAGCCSRAECRCSACWVSAGWPVDERRPAVAQAFEYPTPHGGGRADGALRARRLDAQVYRLARLLPRGIHPLYLWHALRGDESFYQPTRRAYRSLPRLLRDSRHFGGRIDLPLAEMENSLTRLQEAGALVQSHDGRWHAVRGAAPRTPRPNGRERRDR